MNQKKHVKGYLLFLVLASMLLGHQTIWASVPGFEEIVLEGNNTIPIMTAGTAHNYNVSANKFTGSNEPWKAFDTPATSSGNWTGWISTVSLSFPAWLQYQYDEKTLITSYYIYPHYQTVYVNKSPRRWRLQGSNDGQQWQTVDERVVYNESSWSYTDPNVQYRKNKGLYFNVANPNYYKYYRLFVRQTYGSSDVAIGTLRLYKPSVITHDLTEDSNYWATASSAYYFVGRDYGAWKAFDRDDENGGTTSEWISDPYDTNPWLAYDTHCNYTAGGYYILPQSTLPNRAPAEWQLQGSNGLSWEVIDTRTDYLQEQWNGEGIFFYIDNPQSYKRYRLNILETCGSDVVSIREFRLFYSFVPLQDCNSIDPGIGKK